MTLYLVLEGKTDGTHQSSRRMVAVETDDEEDLGEIQFVPDDGNGSWALGNEMDGWWRIVEAYECVEPTEELHENRFPVAYALSDDEFSKIVKEANNG